MTLLTLVQICLKDSQEWGETQKARKDILGKKNDDQKARNQKRRRCWGIGRYLCRL